MQGSRKTWRASAAAACILSALFVLMSTASCSQQTTARPMSTAESAQALEALTTWFECEECQEGELAAVTKYGEAVVPSLIAVLNGGLSPASRERMRLDLESRYDQLTARAQQHPNQKLASTKDEFTALYLGNFDAQYRVRAAQAL